MPIEKVQLSLHASQLKNVAGLGKGTSDPLAIVTQLATAPGEAPRVLGKTEVIKNTLSPNWTTSFLIDYGARDRKSTSKRCVAGLGSSRHVRETGLAPYLPEGESNDDNNKMGWRTLAARRGNEMRPMGVRTRERAKLGDGPLWSRVASVGRLAQQRTEEAGCRMNSSDTALPTTDGILLCNTAQNIGPRPIISHPPSAFQLTTELGKETHLNISVVDEVRKRTDKPMGSAAFEVGDVLGSRGCVKAKKLQRGGTLYARVNKAPPRDAGQLALRLRGIKLKNVEGLFGKSDPFYELRRTYDGPGGGAWTPVHRSKHVKNDLNPVWEPATIDVNALCEGNLDRRIQVCVFDHESSGKHAPMGTFETSVNELVRKSPNGTFAPKRGSKPYGTIRVDECKITGAASASATVLPPPTAAAAAAADPEVVSAPVQQFGAMNVGGGGRLPAPPPQTKPPTFVDYISGNCELSMCVAIDFTGSNGDPRRPGTLHHFGRDGQMNGYEKAISAVGGILAKYDSDQMFPVWGFGAKYAGVVRHCFQVGQSQAVHGVAGILEAYKSVFKTPLVMSGPTVFTEVISLAAAEARSRQEKHPLSYTILLLLTDGAVTDVEATKQTLASVADAPLSIVIVGIGNADFSAMQFLDDFERRNSLNRDIVQFVQFNLHQHNKTSLTRATLEEIPDQVVQFFHRRHIMPQPQQQFSMSRISVDSANEDVDIDLSMNYQDDGEIVLNGNQPGAYIDNSYEAGLGNLHAMPPPSASQEYNPHATPAAPTAPGMPPPMPVPVPQQAPSQPMVFQVQVPPGISAGMQLQVAHPKTGQLLVVAVPQGVPPGGVFSVSA
ncbi:hypothetical protein ACHAWF_015046 [Thalassiosira exigua]